MQDHHNAPAAVVALAGRRVDAEDAETQRFPSTQVPLVRERLAELLAAEGAEALVCSAACGADLLALEVAERLGLRRRIVLPFALGRFRETSVVDRPGDWGPVFDRLVAAAEAAGDLVVLEAGDGSAAYAAANEAILREARALATGAPRRLVAVVAWEGSAREGSDATEGFRQLATQAGFEPRFVPTL
ncbi:hypothetical protein ACLF3G_23510 [Falsiroseomonas sp. HC035]|uniref:hypothetical protein n=1 Tax=Falsiroseomonas sp. HC035 TaxID=3390999 RepID=UPI003D31B00C